MSFSPISTSLIYIHTYTHIIYIHIHIYIHTHTHTHYKFSFTKEDIMIRLLNNFQRYSSDSAQILISNLMLEIIKFRTPQVTIFLPQMKSNYYVVSRLGICWLTVGDVVRITKPGKRSLLSSSDFYSFRK